MRSTEVDRPERRGRPGNRRDRVERRRRNTRIWVPSRPSSEMRAALPSPPVRRTLAPSLRASTSPRSAVRTRSFSVSTTVTAALESRSACASSASSSATMSTASPDRRTGACARARPLQVRAHERHVSPRAGDDASRTASDAERRARDVAHRSSACRTEPSRTGSDADSSMRSWAVVASSRHAGKRVDGLGAEDSGLVATGFHPLISAGNPSRRLERQAKITGSDARADALPSTGGRSSSRAPCCDACVPRRP